MIPTPFADAAGGARRLISRVLVATLTVGVASGCTPALLPSEAAVSPSPTPTLDPVAEAAAREAYAVALCPVLVLIQEADPRLLNLRAAGAGGGDVSLQAEEVMLVIAALGDIQANLNDIPDWAAGRRLHLEFVRALHEIRVALERASDLLTDGSADAAAALAAIPFIVTDEMELALNTAVEAGFDCAVAAGD